MDYRLRPRMFRADSGRPLCNLHDPLLRFCAPTTLRRIARAANAADVLHSRHSPSLRGGRRHRTIPLRRIVHRRVRLTASVDNPFSAPTGRKNMANRFPPKVGTAERAISDLMVKKMVEIDGCEDNLVHTLSAEAWLQMFDPKCEIIRQDIEGWSSLAPPEAKAFCDRQK